MYCVYETKHGTNVIDFQKNPNIDILKCSSSHKYYRVKNPSYTIKHLKQVVFEEKIRGEIL